MSLLGYGIAGGIAGVGKGLTDVAAHKRKLEGERLRDKYLMKRVKQQQEFQKGQAEKTQEFQKSERLEDQEFRSDEAEKGREFTAGEGEKPRQHQEGLAEKDREFRSGEAEKGRDFQREENRKNRALRRDLETTDLSEGPRPMTFSEESDAQEMLAVKFRLTRLAEEAEILDPSNPEDEELLKQKRDAIERINEKIDHYITVMKATGKWPHEINVTRSTIKSWERNKGKSYEDTVKMLLALGYVIPPSLLRQPRPLPGSPIAPEPSHLPDHF